MEYFKLVGPQAVKMVKCTFECLPNLEGHYPYISIKTEEGERFSFELNKTDVVHIIMKLLPFV